MNSVGDDSAILHALLMTLVLVIISQQEFLCTLRWTCGWRVFEQDYVTPVNNFSTDHDLHVSSPLFSLSLGFRACPAVLDLKS